MFHLKPLGASPFRFFIIFLPILLLIISSKANAQKGASGKPPGHDVIVFKNGDRLTGKLIIVVNGKVSFASDMLGKITVKMKDVKTLRTAESFIVVQNGQHLSHSRPQTPVPYGKVSVQDDEITVGQPGASVSIPLGKAEFIVNRTTFENAMYGRPGWNKGWSGTLTAGATVVEATQSSRSFTGSAALTRTVPGVDWMSPRYRSSIGFSATYGVANEPGVPATRTNIVHAELEHDQFFAQRFFALGLVSFAHNFSQGLDLQQIYGAGIGYTVLKTPAQELDLKTDIHYEGQSFSAAPGVSPPIVSPTRHLVGMDFGDNYALNLFQGIRFEQTLTAVPTFNYLRAYSADGTASVLFPISKKFSFNLGARADFLNDPGFGSKKNSVQFTAGIGYSLE